MPNLRRALAGTDYDKHLDFTQPAERKRRTLQKQLTDNCNADAGSHGTYAAADELWRSPDPTPSGW